MKYGASSFIWRSPFSNDDFPLLEVVKAKGFDFFEVAVEDPQLIDPVKLKEAADKVGLELIVCGAFGPTRDISSFEEENRKGGVEYSETLIDFAQTMGSPQVIGPIYSAVGKANLLSKDERKLQWQLATENLKYLTDYAGERGVRIALEPLNRFETDFINTVDQGLELIDLVGAPNLGFLLDVFHMHIEEKNSGEAIKRAGERLFHLHVCSNDRGIPGSGQIDWEGVSGAIKALGYDGHISIESFTLDLKEIAKAVSFWREIFPSSDILTEEGLKFIKNLFG